MSGCPCGSNTTYEVCCGPILSGAVLPETAEALMRARYTAYARKQTEFLGESLHPDHRHDYDSAATRRWAENSQWLGLEVVACTGGGGDDVAGEVEFVAVYKENEAIHRHHEKSQFTKLNGRWYFVDGKIVPPATQVNISPKVGRNDPCPCGSGKKYKKCCMNNQLQT